MLRRALSSLRHFNPFIDAAAIAERERHCAVLAYGGVLEEGDA